jgi:preprotein translocase subunit SecG
MAAADWKYSPRALVRRSRQARKTGMTTVLIVIHLLLALALIGVVLLQRSEGGGLGIGGGGGMGGFMSGRGTANLLSRTTAILAACFMLTSLALTLLASGAGEQRSIVDELPATAPMQPAPEQQDIPAQQEPAQPQQPQQPQQPAVPVQ